MGGTRWRGGTVYARLPLDSQSSSAGAVRSPTLFLASGPNWLGRNLPPGEGSFFVARCFDCRECLQIAIRRHSRDGVQYLSAERSGLQPASLCDRL